MALRYPTQPLRVAANTPTLSILHFVDPEEDTRPPDVQTLVRNFANFWPPMAYTIKDKKQVEHNFVTLIRARARCAMPMSLELHPVEWLHAAINSNTGTLQNFASWDELAILRTLTNATQRLGGRRKGSTLESLQHRTIRDTFRMYNPRTEPQANTATILSNKHLLGRPPDGRPNSLSMLPDTERHCTQTAKEPNRKVLPISDAMPNNPKMAMEIFFSLIARQREEGNYVYESYLTAVRTY